MSHEPAQNRTESPDEAQEVPSVVRELQAAREAKWLDALEVTGGRFDRESMLAEVMALAAVETFEATSGLRQELAQAQAENERLRRGGKELGRILDRTLKDALDASGRHDAINEDGDGDWGVVWETLAELRPRAEAAEAREVSLRKAIEALADEWQDVHDRGVNGRHGYHNGEYGDNYAADLRAALAAEPTPAAEPHAEDGALCDACAHRPVTHTGDGLCLACDCRCGYTPAPVADPSGNEGGE